MPKHSSHVVARGGGVGSDCGWTGRVWIAPLFLAWHVVSALVLTLAVLAPLSLLLRCYAVVFASSKFRQRLARLPNKVYYMWTRGSLVWLYWWGVRIRCVTPRPSREFWDRARRSPQVISCNHRSDFDYLFCLAAIPGSTRFVMKDSLRAIPVLGWAASLLGHVFLERENRGRDLKVLGEAAQRSTPDDQWTLIFPEGTTFQKAVRDHRNETYTRHGSNSSSSHNSEVYQHTMFPKTHGTAELLLGGGGGVGVGSSSAELLQMTLVFRGSDFLRRGQQQATIDKDSVFRRGIPSRVEIHMSEPVLVKDRAEVPPILESEFAAKSALIAQRLRLNAAAAAADDDSNEQTTILRPSWSEMVLVAASCLLPPLLISPFVFGARH